MSDGIVKIIVGGRVLFFSYNFAILIGGSSDDLTFGWMDKGRFGD